MRHYLSQLFLIVAAIFFAGCAGRMEIVRPAPVSSVDNIKIVEKSREVLWNAAVPALSRQFFVINNLDKSSGFINLSYTGNPEQYIDCGRVISFVKNARGERTHDFAGAVADQNYEIMDANGLFFVQRKMSLEGRVNLVLEDISPDKTRVTASVRYVLTRSGTVRNVQGQSSNFNNSISFNSGAGASFPAGSNGQALVCVPTGKIEREILNLIN